MKRKQLSRIENNARAIINDKNLSERTKRYRLKQLLNSKAIEQDMTYQSFQFDNDPVVNGILWQEILNKLNNYNLKKCYSFIIKDYI